MGVLFHNCIILQLNKHSVTSQSAPKLLQLEGKNKKAYLGVCNSISTESSASLTETHLRSPRFMKAS